MRGSAGWQPVEVGYRTSTRADGRGVGAHRAALADAADQGHVLQGPSADPQRDALPALYRLRLACVGCLKEARGLATRYEKLAVHYLALLKLAIMCRLLKRLLHPPSHRA